MYCQRRSYNSRWNFRSCTNRNGARYGAAYTLVIGDKLSWQTAMGVVFLSGLVFLILTFLGLRRRLVEAIPISLVSAMAVGIGLFITFIGLQNLGLVVNNDATLVSAGKITGTVLIGLAGLAVMVFLEAKKIKGSLLIGIIFATLLAAVFNNGTDSRSH